MEGGGLNSMLTFSPLEVHLTVLLQLLGASLSLNSLVPYTLRLPGQLLGLKFIIENLSSHWMFHLLPFLLGLLFDPCNLSSEALAVHIEVK